MRKTVAFLQFLLQKARIRPHLMLCSYLFTQCYFNFAYKTLICDKMKQFGIHPDRKLIARIEE